MSQRWLVFLGVVRHVQRATTEGDQRMKAREKKGHTDKHQAHAWHHHSFPPSALLLTQSHQPVELYVQASNLDEVLIVIEQSQSDSLDHKAGTVLSVVLTIRLDLYMNNGLT